MLDAKLLFVIGELAFCPVEPRAMSALQICRLTMVARQVAASLVFAVAEFRSGSAALCIRGSDCGYPS